MKRAVVFPPVCPHCLQPATATVGIESGRTLSGFYVFFTRWKYSAIQVPFCARFARRLRIANVVWTASFFVLLGLIGILACISRLDGGEAFVLSVLVMGPAWIPLWILRPDKYIQLLATTDESIEFGIVSEQYAQNLAAINGTQVAAWYD